MIRWSIKEWIEYLLHPRSVLMVSIRNGFVSVLSSEGTEKWIAPKW